MQANLLRPCGWEPSLEDAGVVVLVFFRLEFGIPTSAVGLLNVGLEGTLIKCTVRLGSVIVNEIEANVPYSQELASLIPTLLHSGRRLGCDRCGAQCRITVIN